MTTPNIPTDVLLMQQLLEEYGFDAENCDPTVINQLLAWTQREAQSILEVNTHMRKSSKSIPNEKQQFLTALHTHRESQPFELNSDRQPL